MVDLRIQLPNNFLEEELRCGYLVSTQMKKVWAVELDLLYEFQRVATKYNIKYIANNGTMLGAVRHKGFIPWDDDIDIMLFRDEYDRLCDVAEKEFKHPYFFQTECTDPGYMHCHAKLRNSETTAILKRDMCGRLKFNQGIFIDIFPLDAIPDSENDWERECKIAQHYYDRMCIFANVSSLYLPDPSDPKYWMKRMMYLGGRTLFVRFARYYYNKYEAECKRYNNFKTDKISLLCWGYKYKKLHRLRIDHEETVMMDFEFLQVPVCKNFDHALTEVFGDWHKFVKGGSIHDGILFDTDKPYLDYLK